MSDGRDTSGTANGESEPEDGRRGPAVEVTLVARVQQYDDQPNTCTIHPVDADDLTVLTTWISAKDGSFVPLDEHR